jgi:hypothetical protein
MSKTLRRKEPVIAVVLQCIPLLAAAGCIASGASDQSASALSCILWWSALLWGLGYVYLGRPARVRAILALVLGPVLAFGACSASFSGVDFDYEHPYRTNSRATIQAANRAAVQTGLIVAAMVLFLAVDAWRLASLMPAEIPESEEQ